jgi:alanine racemase
MRSDLIARINTDALIHNLHALTALCGSGVRFCAPLKANAYGHGAAIVAPALAAASVDFAAVATVIEGIELRDLGWTGDILVLGNVLAVADEAERRERLTAASERRLAMTLVDRQIVEWVGRCPPARPVDVHVKVDTGMGRMGAMPEDVRSLVRAVRQAGGLRLTGIYSHFATADFALQDVARRQLAAFQLLLDSLDGELPPGTLRHVANSAATITMPDAHFDMVRPGLALYGYPPSAAMGERINLCPILRLVSHLSSVKRLPAGHGVGYGQTFTTHRETRVGLIPVGYFDGFLRSLSNLAIVTTPHGEAPVIGRVSMDQLAVDLTDLAEMAVGTPIALIDDAPHSRNSVVSLAEQMGTIPYEVTCLLGPRIDRVAVVQAAVAPAAGYRSSRPTPRAVRQPSAT